MTFKSLCLAFLVWFHFTGELKCFINANYIVIETLKNKQLQNLINCKILKSNTVETKNQSDGTRFEDFIGN